MRRLTRERKDELEPELREWRFWRFSGARLIAGMRYLGEWEARCD